MTDIQVTEPLFAVSGYMLPDTSLQEDLGLANEIGATGLSVLERKLDELDESIGRELFKDKGVTPVTFSPSTISPLPAGGNQYGSEDPTERIAAMLASVERFAPFQPESILVLTGSDPRRSAGDARRIVVEGIREVARAAAQRSLTLTLEPIRTDLGIRISIVENMAQTLDLLDEIGEDNVYIAFDIWHLWDTKDVIPLARAHAGRIRGVHVADWRAQTRSWCDRVLPGDGVIDLPPLFEAVREGGYQGWYHLEAPSDDGRYGFDFPDSLWKLPAREVLSRGKSGFEAAWFAPARIQG